MRNPTRLLILTTALFPLGMATAQLTPTTFYKESQLFSTAPGREKSVNTIDRFGPVGMAIELHQPAFTMVVGDHRARLPGRSHRRAQERPDHRVDQRPDAQGHRPAHPARPDPRGRRSHRRRRQVRHQGRGRARSSSKSRCSAPTARPGRSTARSPTRSSATSPTTLPNPESNKGFADIGMLFLLSTGEDKDLAPVREWVHGLDRKRHHRLRLAHRLRRHSALRILPAHRRRRGPARHPEAGSMPPPKANTSTPGPAAAA